MGHRDRQLRILRLDDLARTDLVVFAEVGEEEANRHSLDTETDEVVERPAAARPHPAASISFPW